MKSSASQTEPAAYEPDFITRKLEEHRRDRALVQQILDTVNDVRIELGRTAVSADLARVAAEKAGTTADAARDAAKVTNANVLQGLGIATALQELAPRLQTHMNGSRHRAKAMLFLLLLLGGIVGWAIFYFQGVARDIDALVRTPIRYEVFSDVGEMSSQIAQWQSSAFAPSGVNCVAWTDVNKRVRENPCDELVKQLKAVLARRTSPGRKLVVFVTGGHDRRPLTAAFARQVGSNEQLAQLRADQVARTLRAELIQHPDVSFEAVVVSRGATNVKSIDDNDRTVIVTLVQLESRGSAQP